MSSKKPLVRVRNGSNAEQLLSGSPPQRAALAAHLRGVAWDGASADGVLYEVIQDIHEDVRSLQGDRITVSLDVSRARYDELQASKPYSLEFRMLSKPGSGSSAAWPARLDRFHRPESDPRLPTHRRLSLGASKPRNETARL